MDVQSALPLLLLLVAGYLLLIRPARRRSQAATALQSALAPGDEVMLSSGLFATVVDLQDEVIEVELAPGIVVRVHRGAITQIIHDRPSPFEGGDDVPDSAGHQPDDDDAGEK